MTNDEDMKRLVNERMLWMQYPTQGDAVRPAKETVIKRLATLAANRDRTNPHAFDRTASGLWSGSMTPEDVLATINMTWKEALRHV